MTNTLPTTQKIAAALSGISRVHVQFTTHLRERMSSREVSEAMVLSAIQNARPSMISKIKRANASEGHTGIVFEITYPYKQFQFDVVLNVTSNGIVKIVTVGPKRCPRTNSLVGPV